MPTKWKTALRLWRGIYYIFEVKVGKGYVGSACGEENILGRWLDYAASGHGGNNHGVKLGSYVGGMKVGDEIVIQYHQKHAQLRVTWIIACEGSSEKQIGAECLEPGNQLWGAPFPQQMDEYEEQQ